MATHTIEPELLAGSRWVVWRTVSRGVGLWLVRLFILPHTLIGFGMLGKAVWSTVSWPVVYFAGSLVEGRIDETTATPNRKNNSTAYSARYTFYLGNDAYHRQTTLSADGYAAVQRGSVVRVRVCRWLPACGDWPDVPGFSSSNFLSFWGVALFWNGVLSLFFWNLYFVPWREAALVRRGVPVVGRITEFGPSGDKERSHRVRYSYRWPTDGGELWVGHTDCRETGGYSIGDVLTVLIDPRRPSRSLAYALSDFRVAGMPRGEAEN